MCLPAMTPALMASIGIGMSAAGTIGGAFNAYQQGKTNTASMKYQASVQKNNQTLAEWQAQDAIRRGQESEADTRMRTAQIKGSQRAMLASRGLDLSEGSPLNLLTDTDFMGERDALRVRTNAKTEAWAYREQAKGYGSAADIFNARADSESPWGAAAGTLLTGGGQVADRWYALKEKGVWG